MRKAQNWPNLLILLILDGKKPNLVKIGNFKWPINPLGHSAQLRGRKNHALLQTFYLKNGRESDMKIEGFFEEEEISYNVAIFGHPRTFLADLASIWSWMWTSDFFIIFENLPWLKRVNEEPEIYENGSKLTKLVNSAHFRWKKSILVKIGNFKWPINPLGHSAQLRGRQNHVVLQTFYLKNGKESDMKIKGFFDEEEISYNVAKFGHPRTFLADLASIWS